MLLKSLICSGPIKFHHETSECLISDPVKLNFTLIVNEGFIDINILIIITFSFVNFVYSSEVTYQEVY